MKSIFKSTTFITLSTISIMATGLMLYGAFGNNSVDEKGQRQGYWVVTGSMMTNSGFPSNSTIEEGNYTNDLKTGVWKKYYPSGALRSEIFFDSNKPNGEYTLYYENGVVEESGNWARNKNTGEFARNYKNGKPHQKFEFSDSGKRNGEQLYYHENGELALQVNVTNGKEVGVMKRYNSGGELTEEKSFDNGSYINGSTKDYSKKENVYVPKPAEIEENSDVKSTAGKVEEEETNSAHHFKPNGHNILYDQNKNISQSGVFKNGRLHNGKWFKYNKNGILLRVDIYRNGKFIGHGLLDED